ncbi:hypothetical protein VD0002_g4308 [Verticillium dahliae]|uniref:Streptomycin biosynthesis protein StrI n=2 Tax=Verticillium dahliae TaxID=27337 RepID=G2WZ84_VERDV|nr:streptomycin biosynthesis protein StrI [Verticillium dahliae VdLs.17]KAF3344722.1 Pisatin demethylase [Verticillium dahliae VDG2]KAH6703724.1 streptomycin biosynthesis protein StrI [Verticillium dahliae]EGY21886.1 streptomycin biosynthesis protein StrI [Verticillium dahliae VdLs.17]PNH28955.1 hypothetical protein BJF96_g7744 [Verticillium dahliae]PNH41779.1 hypothetical protein VD0004_g5416 [Verticillium dahliae]
MSPPRFLVIGAGSRGYAYAGAITDETEGIIAAVAEPIPYKRTEFGRDFIWGADGSPQEGQSFPDWNAFLTYETARRAAASAGDSVPPGVDGVLICVLDEMHREVIMALAPLGLHTLCEKPLVTTLKDCLDIHRALKPSALFSVGHVLRYSPHNMLLRRLLLSDRAIGDIVSIEHTEPVGWWHFAHSYVRGNWRREATTAPSLLTKSCHDVDLLLWLLAAPYKSGSAHPFHVPVSVSSTGALTTYRKARKPTAAGHATNCMTCPLADDGCKFSAKKIYLGPELASLETGNRSWPVKIVLPEIEDMPDLAQAKEALAKKLGEDYSTATPDREVAARPWFGRCVYESDNDVCDDQFVTLAWDDEPSIEGAPPRFAKQATLHMVATTKKICERYSHIYGTNGEIFADSRTITVEDFSTGQTTVYNPKMELSGHGGGDMGLARQFVLAVQGVKNEGMEVQTAQDEFIGCSLGEAIMSHLVVFAAEEARREGKVVKLGQWWDRVSKGELQSEGHEGIKWENVTGRRS